MTIERKFLFASLLLSIAGWSTVAALATGIGAFKLRAEKAEDDAANWKRQASKAYTEMLKAHAGTDSTLAIIPAGARIDCTMSTTVVDGRTLSKCLDGTIFPPRNF